MNTSAFIPSPGSPVATMQGCICPVGDNNDGQGAIPGHFWIDSECRLHGEAHRSLPTTVEAIPLEFS